MMKKIGLLLVGVMTSLAMSITAYAHPMVTEETTVADVTEGNGYMTIVRATGEVEMYPLDKLELGMNTVATDDVTVVEDVLTRQSTSVCAVNNNSLIQPLASAYTFNWTIRGGYIGYANHTFDLQKGDWVSFTLAVDSEFSVKVGLYDKDTKEFISAGIWSGTDDEWNIGDSFGASKDLDNVSFAIYNISDESQTFVGSYTIP